MKAKEKVGVPVAEDAGVMPVEELLRRCVEIIRRYLPAKEGWEIWVFGSQVAGRAQPWSDLDLAVRGAGAVPLATLARIREEIEQLPTLRSVDLVDLASVGGRLKEVVLQEGRRVG